MLEYYLKPKTIKEAIELLKQYAKEATIVAGGTDVMVNLKTKKLKARGLISITEIKELVGITSESDGSFCIGACTTMSDITENAALKKAFPILSEAASELGSHSIRNRATIGGSLCNSSPAGELAPVLIALGATLELVGNNTSRKLLVEDFILGPGKNALQEEILTAITIPPRPNHVGKYIKFGTRKSMEISIVSAACVIETSLDKKCTYACLILGAVAPKPLVIPACSESLMGINLTQMDSNLVQKIADAASAAAMPISDIRASAEYRKRTAGVLAKRAIQEAWQKVEGDA